MIRKGQRYRTERAIEVTCLTAWRAPFTGGYKRTLPAGEEFMVANDPPAQATAVYADPVNYNKLHRAFVPWTDRIRFLLYNGYYLGIAMQQIEQSCRLVGESADDT